MRTRTFLLGGLSALALAVVSPLTAGDTGQAPSQAEARHASVLAQLAARKAETAAQGHRKARADESTKQARAAHAAQQARSAAAAATKAAREAEALKLKAAKAGSDPANAKARSAQAAAEQAARKAQTASELARTTEAESVAAKAAAAEARLATQAAAEAEREAKKTAAAAKAEANLSSKHAVAVKVPRRVLPASRSGKTVMSEASPQPAVSGETSAPPAPTLDQADTAPRTRQQKLEDLLKLYRSEQITPRDYFARRAQIVAEP